MNSKTPVPAVELNPLEQAYRNYQTMEQLLERTNERNRVLEIDNRALNAELEMVREQLIEAEHDRIRLHHISSTLSGELGAIQAVINAAVRRAVEGGVNAVQAAERPAEPAHKPEPEAAPQVLTKLGGDQEAWQGHPGVPGVTSIGSPLPPPVFRDLHGRSAVRR